MLLAFGFSNCGEVCPITLATLAGARKKLGDAGANVQVVYVTVDPERDDARADEEIPRRASTHLRRWRGHARADRRRAEELRHLAPRRQVYADGSYTIGHSSSIYMIDRAGGLRAVMPYGHTVDDFVHDLKILLRQ